MPNRKIKSVTNWMPRIHREGYPFICVFIVITVLAGVVAKPLGWLGLALTVWCVVFFRDPKRTTISSPRVIVAPADGRVSCVQSVSPPPELGLSQKEFVRVSIFMNAFNCHVNRSPITGSIRKIKYRPGKFVNATLDKASEGNECNGIVIANNMCTIAVIQIAGFIARRIVSWVKEGQELAAGERFGMIRFGSRLDVYVPKDVYVLVSVGQTTVAGETIIATLEQSIDTESTYHTS